MCSSCQGKLRAEEERDSGATDDARAQLASLLQKVVYGNDRDDLFVIISDCCSKAEGFFAPDLPIMEIIFRILLANANQPLALEEIKERLDEGLATGERAITISLETLKRLLDNDRYYGLRRFPAPEYERSDVH